MTINLLWTSVLLSCVITKVMGATSCDYRPVPACTCWNPRRPSISCMDAGLTKLPALPLDYVHSLDLSYNNITITLKDVLGHSGLVLTKFVMSHSLSKTKFNIRNFYFFQHIQNSLKWLDLSHNKRLLTAFPKAISRLHALEHLDLSYNNIYSTTTLKENIMVNLKTLYLAGNPIKYIYKHSFMPMEQLQRLSLTLKSSTFFYKSKSDVSKALRNLTYFHLTKMDFSITTRSLDHLWKFFYHFKKLEHVRIEKSSKLVSKLLEKFDELLAESKNTLKYLSLADNTLKTIPFMSLEGLPHVQELDLSENKINAFGPQFCTRNLRKLILHDNQFHGDLQLSSMTRYNCSNDLDSLDLRNNQIEYVGQDVNCTDSITFPNPLKILLGGNPLACDDCKKLDWLSYSQKHDDDGQKLSHCLEMRDRPLCASPRPMIGKTLVEAEQACVD